MPVIQSEAVNNRLLAALSSKALTTLLPKLTRVPLPFRQLIQAEDGPISFVYFPVSGLVSLVSNLADGTQAEVGLIGREGAVGLPLLAGINRSYVEAVVQIPGTALRVAAKDFFDQFDTDPTFRAAVLRSLDTLQSQIMQTAICNGRHELGQRLARWLLMCQDRQGEDMVPLTQELLATMLGVHRPSVTVAARTLRRAGLITYSSGRITITDRPGLENAACDCYAALRRRDGILFPEPGTAPA